jgi:hypothetical protein
LQLFRRRDEVTTLHRHKLCAERAELRVLLVVDMLNNL